MPNTASISFGEIRGIDRKIYVRERILLLSQASNALFNGDNQASLSRAELIDQVDVVIDSLDVLGVPPLARVVDLSTISSGQSAQIRRRKVCMQNEATTLFPLMDGEIVEKDQVSYLTQEWQGFPAKAIVLRRLSNLSLTYVLFPNTLADPDNQVLIDTNFINEEFAIPGQVSLVAINFGAAAKTLATGLLGLAPPPLNVLGATLLTAFWPTSNDATKQWQQVYESLQTIVKNALVRNNVSLASQRLAGFINFLNTTYKSLKDTPTTSKQELFDSLIPFDVAFFQDIVNIFMYSDEERELAGAALANFMTSASTHLALNQERALVDPKAPSPATSAYAQTVIRLSSLYADYANRVGAYIRDQRLAQISKIISESTSSCNKAGCTTIRLFYFRDDNTGYRSPTYSYNSKQKDPPDARGDANKALGQYRAMITDEITAILKDQVFSVTDLWAKLSINPLPA